MSMQHYGKAYSGTAAENYEKYFVPAIGAPVAEDLLQVAALRLNERVLDVACGTGVLTRRAAESVGSESAVAGLDVNPGMLATARESTPSGMMIKWHEASAEKMPFPNASFDVVLCQMGLQFIPDKEKALNEMQRVLAPGGRAVINIPGPKPAAFAILAEALASHIEPQAAGFVNLVFSLHDSAMVKALLESAGFGEVFVDSGVIQLCLPAPEKFLWEFVYSTPLSAFVADAAEEKLAALEREVIGGWQPFVEGRDLVVDVRMVKATARKV